MKKGFRFGSDGMFFFGFQQIKYFPYNALMALNIQDYHVT